MIFIGRDIGMLEGSHAEDSKILHNALEFMIHFGQYYPDIDRAELHIRIITSPCYTKNFLETLRVSITQYDREIGIFKER